MPSKMLQALQAVIEAMDSGKLTPEQVLEFVGSQSKQKKKTLLPSECCFEQIVLDNTAELERDIISKAYEAEHGDIKETARRLSLSEKDLREKIKELGLKPIIS